MATTTNQKIVSPTVKNSSTSPIVYFDAVPAFGHFNGVVEIELASRVLVPNTDSSVKIEVSFAGHLRCSLQAAVNLRDAIDGALKMAAENGLRLAS